MNNKNKLLSLTHVYWHWRADVHSAGFVPVLSDINVGKFIARNPPMPITLIVMGKRKKKAFAHPIAFKNQATCLSVLKVFPL